VKHVVKKDVYLLWTPALYKAHQQDLLQVISDIRANSPYHTLKMPIRAFIYFGSFCARDKRLENECQGDMKELTLKLTEVGTTRVFFITWQ